MNTLSRFIASLLLSVLLSAAACAESIQDFYKEFRKSEDFRLNHTQWPLKVVATSLGATDGGKARTVTKKQVRSGKEKVYPNYRIVAERKFVEVWKRKNDDEYELLIGPPNSEAAVSYLFKRADGVWRLVKYTDLFAE